jgi:hypothetical protein
LEQASNPSAFVFFTEQRLVALTGLRASTLRELARLMRRVPGSAIFYHTHHAYLSHHFERPTFTNDFARWVGEALQERELGEKLAAVDLLDYTSVRSLRDALVAIIDRHLKGKKSGGNRCRPGDEFHFCQSRSFVMTSGLEAKDPKQFFEVLAEVTRQSIFFHFLEARLRLERHTNDFSAWLEANGENNLARVIETMNPYEQTLDDLKNRIVRLGEKRFGAKA